MRMSESAVGRLVTETLQTCLSPTASETALVTSACGRAVFVRSAQGVSARAPVAAARPSAATAQLASILVIDRMQRLPVCYRDLGTGEGGRLPPPRSGGRGTAR